VTASNVLFLTWGEPVYDSGIFVNLILEQLISLKKYDDVCLRVLCGVPVITRMSLFQREYWHKSKKRLLGLFRSAGIPLRIRNIPVPSSFFRSKFWEFPFLYVGHVLYLTRYLMKNSIDAVLCRSYHSAAIALLAKKLFRLKIRIVFDPRSTFPEEVVLTGRAGKNSASLTFWRRLEKILLRRSDVVVTISDGLAKHFRSRSTSARFITIYASIDLSKFFTKEHTQRAPIATPATLAFLGNVANDSFHSITILAAVYNAYRIKLGGYARLLIITKADPHEVANALLRCSIKREELTINTAHSVVECNRLLCTSTHTVVPFKEIESPFDYIMAATMIGSKVPEYLAARKPILYNKAVQSLHNILSSSIAGIPFTFTDGKVEFLKPIDPEYANSDIMAAECERLAGSLFDVQESSRRYHDVLVGVY
jgi:hypothetical protein